MIVANLATFPPREGKLEEVISQIRPQVDTLNVVFNEYEKVPEKYLNIDGLNPIIPIENTRDTGKFYPDTSNAKWVLLIDDDIDYPPDYVATTIGRMERLRCENAIGGYHTSIYRKPVFRYRVHNIKKLSIYWCRWRKVANLREVCTFYHEVTSPYFVDQIGTGAAIIPGKLMPTYAFMRDSQKYVDVRLARWCFEKSICCVALPKEPKWLQTEDDKESIFRTFTSRHHRHVSKEIWSFAFKRDFLGEILANHR